MTKSLIERTMAGSADSVVLHVDALVGNGAEQTEDPGLTLADVKALDRAYRGIYKDDPAMYRCKVLYNALHALCAAGVRSVDAAGVKVELAKDRLDSMDSAMKAYGWLFDIASGRCMEGKDKVQ